jgi:hypothetical protein
MKDIYLALAHARDRINRPLATRYTLSLTMIIALILRS